GEHGGRTLAPGPLHFARPDGYSIAHAARGGLQPAIGPVGLTPGMMEQRLAIEAVEVSANQRTVLHAHAVIVDEIGHAAGGVDLVVGAAGRARLGLDDLDSVA